MIQESLFSESLRLLLPSDPALTAQSLKLTSIDRFLSGLTLGQVISGNIVERLPSGKAVVKFNEHRVAVDIGRNVPVGKNLQARVEQLSPTPLLKLVSPTPSARSEGGSQHSVLSSGSQVKADVVRFSNQPQLHNQLSGILSRDELASLGLKTGDRTTAEVLSTRADGTARALVKGQETVLVLSGGRTLAPGSRVAIEVRQQAEGFVLATAKDGVQKTAVDLLKTLLPHRQPLDGLIRNLEQQLQELIRQGGVLPDNIKNRLDESFKLFRGGEPGNRTAAELKNSLERSGVGYEAKIKSLFEQGLKPELKGEVLRDFKGQLHELSRLIDSRAGSLSKASPDTLQALGKQVNATLQNIEILQINHFMARQEQLPLALLLPATLENNSGQFKIFFREDAEDGQGGNEKNRKGYNLVFLLDMSRLGKMRVDAKIQGQSIDLNVFVENEAVLNLREEGFGAFQDQLKDLGFDGQIQGQIDPAKFAVEDQENEFKLLENINSLVDIRT